MNELTLTELDMGSATPRILGASKPSIDYQGKREIRFIINTHKHTPLVVSVKRHWHVWPVTLAVWYVELYALYYGMSHCEVFAYPQSTFECLKEQYSCPDLLLVS